MPKITYQDYKHLILDLISQKGAATREDIVNLIMPTLSPDEPMNKKIKKIANIITRESAKEKAIINSSNSDKYPIWVLP